MMKLAQCCVLPILLLAAPDTALAQTGAPSPLCSISTDEQILDHNDLDLALDNNIFDTRFATSMVGIASCWNADEDDNTSRDISETYAHWSIREISRNLKLKDSIRDYKGESEPGIVRLFVGRDRSMVASVRIDLHDPDLSFTVPLANLAYQGRVGKGQSWSTLLTADDQTLPFFRIGPTTSATVTLTARSTDALQVQAASTVLTALRDLSGLVSPGAALATSLNRESIRQSAITLDNALSNIWSQSRDEGQATARQLSEWRSGARIILQVAIPSDFKSEATSGQNPKTRKQFIKFYELSLSCPRLSIFVSKLDCDYDGGTSDPLVDKSKLSKDLIGRVSSQQILNYRVSAGVTTQQFLASLDWYVRFLRIGDVSPANDNQKVIATDASRQAVANQDNNSLPVVTAQASSQGASVDVKPNAQPAERSQADYAALCTSIVNAFYGLGFSATDSRIGLWAVVTGSRDMVGLEPYFQSNPQCLRLLPFSELGTQSGWSFAVVNKPAATTPAGATRKSKLRRNNR